MNQQDILEKINDGTFTTVRKRNGKSAIWNFFMEIQREDGSLMEGSVFCRACKHLLKFNGKNSSNLNRHKCFINASRTITLKEVSAEDKDAGINVISDWVTEDCRPFSVVEGSGFLKLALFLINIGARYGENVNIHTLIPDATTISRRVNSKAISKRNEIKPDIKKLVEKGEASVTTDLWTDNYIKRQFLAVTMHFCRKSTLHSLVLGVKSMDFQRSTGENIFNKIKNLFQEYDIQSLNKLVFVTDRGSNIKSALKDNIRINCSNHLMSNILEIAFESTTELSGIIQSCKKLVKYIKKANLQHMLDTSLKSHCPTRWNSHLAMFKSINENWSKLEEILSNNSEYHRLADINLPLLKCLITLCEYFETISDNLQSVSSPSICFVMPSITRLKIRCQRNMRDCQAISNFKAKVSKEIDEKWSTNVDIYHKVACFLYPPTNNFHPNFISEIKEFCIDELITLENHDLFQSTDMSSNTTLVPPPTLTNNLDRNTSMVSSSTNPAIHLLFPDLLTQPEPSVSATESAVDEIERYSLERVRLFPDFDVLKWWELRSDHYPRLSKLAFRILSIPASSAASERVFSMAGNIITEKRSRLKPKTVNNILFLNSVVKNYESQENSE